MSNCFVYFSPLKHTQTGIDIIMSKSNINCEICMPLCAQNLSGDLIVRVFHLICMWIHNKIIRFNSMNVPLWLLMQMITVQICFHWANAIHYIAHRHSNRLLCTPQCTQCKNATIHCWCTFNIFKLILGICVSKNVAAAAGAAATKTIMNQPTNKQTFIFD